jgi:hypothetical protein
MAYPSGLKIFIDGKDATYYITGSNTFDPDVDRNTFRDIDIAPYLRKTPGIHTIEITAEDGNGRAECRVEIR